MTATPALSSGQSPVPESNTTSKTLDESRWPINLLNPTWIRPAPVGIIRTPLGLGAHQHGRNPQQSASSKPRINDRRRVILQVELIIGLDLPGRLHAGGCNFDWASV